MLPGRPPVAEWGKKAREGRWTKRRSEPEEARMTGSAGPPRLSIASLSGLRPSSDRVELPRVDPRSTTVGIVHLGIGAFHRAHQAVFTEDAAAAAGEDCWGILGVSSRSRRVAQQLVPQDGLYGILTTGRAATSLRLIGSVRGVAFQPDEPERVLNAIAADTTHVVSLTVSEKGYRRAHSGGPDLTDPDLGADVAAIRDELAAHAPRAQAGAALHTPIGALVLGLARRQWAHGAPLTVVCCDNMTANGRVLAGLVKGVLDAVPGPRVASLRSWVEESVRFPNTMVDRITPATTEAHRAESTSLLGLGDEGLVVAEPFREWVIEDAFAGPRPQWEFAGARITRDVEPYERAKLRMLNGSHSAIAYVGALRGHRRIDQALDDDVVLSTACRLMDEDVIPSLTPPEGVDLAGYRSQILERFANPGTGYTTYQVAGDGSHKLPIRILDTVADRLAAGVVPNAATQVVAAWIVFVARRRDVHGHELPLEDPWADRLSAAAAGPEGSLADRMLALREVFPAEIAEHDGFRAALRAEVAKLLSSL
jgi:fructuronate reductase